MLDCVFCKITAGQLPSEKLYEDENVVAILDIKPVRPGHTLIITKTHVPDFSQAPIETIDKILLVAQKVAGGLVAATGADGFNLTTNNGRAAGQIIDHLHFHLIPRHHGDGLKMWSHHDYAEGEMKKMGGKIREKL